MQETKTSVNNLFLLGAGFTKAVFDDAPLNKDLLEKLLKNNPKSKLKKYQTKDEDIEILLTHIDLKIASEENSNNKLEEEEERKDIETEIADYFKKFRFNKEVIEDKKWLKSFATKVFQQDDLVVSLNYDCFFEGLLDFCGVWTPNKGYGCMGGPFTKGLPLNSKNIQIYKIHGSENFRKAKALNKKKSSFLKIELNKNVFPKSGRGYDCNYNKKDWVYIIAPSFVKNPHETISRMMIEVLDKVRSARNFIIIGCGLRREDNFLWLLLTKFLYAKPENRTKLIIVDPKAKDIKQKIENYFFKNMNVLTIEERIEDSINSLLG
ncbi:SIR2 family protein [bacterium]|nr:SIR2 family protein [bacterium]